MDHVYVMRDPRHPNDIKVGFSINPLKRREQLFRTNTPLPFNIYAVWAVHDHRYAEKVAHSVLDGHRIYYRREWFEVIPPESSLWVPGIESCYDTTTTCLDTLIELIEESFSYAGVQAIRIHDYEDLAYSVSLEDITFLV